MLQLDLQWKNFLPTFFFSFVGKLLTFRIFISRLTPNCQKLMNITPLRFLLQLQVGENFTSESRKAFFMGKSGSERFMTSSRHRFLLAFPCSVLRTSLIHFPSSLVRLRQNIHHLLRFLLAREVHIKFTKQK